MQTIKGYDFQLNKPIYLHNQVKNKFWEANINDNEVKYRAGVLREGHKEFKIKQVDKQYDSHTLAKAKVITKIADKIGKRGYISKTANKVEPEPKAQDKPTRRKKLQKLEYTCDQTDTNPTKPKRGRKSKVEINQNNLQSQKTMWKGLQKDTQIIEFYVMGNQLKITRKDGQKQSTETKDFKNYNDAVNWVMRRQRIFQTQGFKSVVSSIVLEQEKPSKDNNQVENPFKSGSNKHLLFQLTNKALQLNSGCLTNLENDEENVYIENTRLGMPVNQCIKCLLAENYKEGTDPTGWIMSQKLDGVRCLWTGEVMYSRNGNKFHFPNFFTKNWPKAQLDGELFIGRGRFSQTLSAVRKNVPVSSQWQKVKYLVFDAPGLKQPFKTRIQVLQEEIAKIDNPFLKCHAHRACKGFADLFYELENVNKVNGEGIMLRKPDALYENKRSKTLQKVKTFYDQEAEIIGFTEGTGRITGWIGAFKVKNNKGVQFQVGSGLNDQIRQNPPPQGTMITYKYQEINKDSGKPRFPTFVRVHVPT